MVAECRNADTGVGASIAVGNHRWNGSCADFVNAASSRSDTAGTNDGLARNASTSRPDNAGLPPPIANNTIATSSARPPNPVTNSALIAPSRDAARVSQKPISRNEEIEVSSQNANVATRLSLRTNPIMAPPKTSSEA